MAMSLIIYIVLLVVFVWLPAHVLMGPAQFQLRTFYLAPQLQVGSAGSHSPHTHPQTGRRLSLTSHSPTYR